jgi:hypothetical protein
MADASKRVEIVMRSWTAIAVYALLSTTPAFAAGGGAIAWDRETGKYGASWNQTTPKRAVEAAISQCGASGCRVVLKVRPMMCGALAISGDSKKAGAAVRNDLDTARVAALTSCQKNKGATDCAVKTADCNK